jgi:hypothetical protein
LFITFLRRAGFVAIAALRRNLYFKHRLQTRRVARTLGRLALTERPVVDIAARVRIVLRARILLYLLLLDAWKSADRDLPEVIAAERALADA